VLGTTDSSSQTVSARDLDKRMITKNFISPHSKRLLKIVLASTIILSANWFFELWIKDFNNGVSLWRGGVGSSTNLQLADAVCPSMIHIYSSPTQYRGSAEFLLTGLVGKGGTSELVIKFTAEIFASAAATYIQGMIVPPTVTLAGVSIDVKSWSLDVQKPWLERDGLGAASGVPGILRGGGGRMMDDGELAV
jgi:hypothetical protein